MPLQKATARLPMEAGHLFRSPSDFRQAVASPALVRWKPCGHGVDKGVVRHGAPGSASHAGIGLKQPL